ncbi:acyltransferase family protein [Geodermatophilus sp. SYSU D01036]
MTEPAFEHSRLPRLTSLRAFAALAVFLFHVGRDVGWAPAAKIFSQSYIGVGFFFVLSGFVLAWTAREGTAARTFYWRRFARIYPVYLLTLLAAAAYLGVTGHPNLAALLLAIVLVQAWTDSIPLAFSVNGPAWSLSCEAAFYAAFPGLRRLAARRWAPAAVAGWWLAAIVLSEVLNRTGHPVAALVNPLLRGSEFAIGVLLAGALRTGRVPRIPLPVALGPLLIGALACRALQVPSPLPETLLAPAFALVIAWAAQADRAGRRGWLTHRWLVFAGDVSYAFYLVHAFVLERLNEHIATPAAVAALGLVIATALACLLHVAVERPCQRLLLAATARRPSCTAPRS